MFDETKLPKAFLAWWKANMPNKFGELGELDDLYLNCWRAAQNACEMKKIEKVVDN